MAKHCVKGGKEKKRKIFKHGWQRVHISNIQRVLTNQLKMNKPIENNYKKEKEKHSTAAPNNALSQEILIGGEGSQHWTP